MARAFVKASSQYAENASAPATAAPITLACWFKANSVGTAEYRMLVTLSASANNANFIALYQWAATLYLDVVGTGNESSTANSSIVANTWTHAVGIVVSATNRITYLNGVVSGADAAVSSIPAGINRFSVGRVARLNPAYYYDGTIAEVGVWNVVLTAQEALALSKGARASMIRPESLVAYDPIWGISSPEADLTTGHRNLTVTGATAAPHAPVALSFGFNNLRPPSDAVAAAATVIPTVNQAPLVPSGSQGYGDRPGRG